MKQSPLPKLLLIVCLQIMVVVADAAKPEQSNACVNPVYQGMSKVPARLQAAMNRISQTYCEADGQQTLMVTSGIRTPELQARLMQNCLRKNACGYYANTAAAAELQLAFNAAGPDEKVKSVAAKINEQVNRPEPCYISKHLTAFGLDIERWHNGRPDQCQNDLRGDDLLLSRVLEDSDDVANVIYREASGCTHFHVNFVGWDQIPGLKRCSKPEATD